MTSRLPKRLFNRWMKSFRMIISRLLRLHWLVQTGHLQDKLAIGIEQAPAFGTLYHRETVLKITGIGKLRRNDPLALASM